MMMEIPFGTDQISRLHAGNRTLTVCQERVRPLPGPWQYVDAAGHEHFYDTDDDDYPTLTRVDDGWADPADDGEDSDDEFERYHLDCVQCGEMIWPAPGGPAIDCLPRVFSYQIDGEPVTKNQAREFAGQLHLSEPDRWERIGPWLKRMGLLPRVSRRS